VDRELKTVIQRSRPDGIILAAPLSNVTKIVDTIGLIGTPFARLSPGEKNGEELSVGTNDREISAEMTRYLASLGHKRIAFIAGDPNHKAVANRFAGYQDGLQQSGLRYSESLVRAGDNSIGSGEAGARKLLARATPPTAIFTANDDMAAGVIRVADQLGVDVPAELSVAGYDDNALARQIYPALTTIRQPLATMAERAALALVSASNDSPLLPGTDIVPASLQIRESTGPAPE